MNTVKRNRPQRQGIPGGLYVELIDDNGRLLGYVNVIDALVVLLVLAVVVAGVALVTQPDQQPEPPEEETRFVTIDLGITPAYIAEQITTGDRYEPTADTTLTITDVYATEAEDGVNVLVRTRLTAPHPGEVFEYNGEPPRLGRSLTISTPTYEVSGRIQTVDRTGASLPLTTVPILLESIVSTEEASRIDIGDQVTTNNQSVATLSQVLRYDTDSPNQRRVVALASVVAYQDRGTQKFANTSLQIGQSIRLRTDDYALTGTILRTDVSRLPTTDTDVVLRLTLPTATAARLSIGDTYDVSGHPIATIESIDAYGTGNPDLTRLYIGVTYRTYQPRARPQFAGRVVREGATLPFRTADYELTGEVVRMNALEQRGRQTTRILRLELENVDPALAANLHAGMAERVRGTTIAELQTVSVEPAEMVLTSDSGEVFLREHPFKKDVTITAELQVRETATGVRFKGTTIQQGDHLVLDLRTLTLRVTITSL